jgi:hypothetical protein
MSSTKVSSTQATDAPMQSSTQSWPVRALMLTGAGIGLGIIFDVLFYGKLPGISFVLYIAIVLAVLIGLSRKLRVTLPRTAYGLMVPLVFFAAMVAIRANAFVIFVDICLSVYLLLAIAYAVFRPQLAEYKAAEYFSIAFAMPARLIRSGVQTLEEAGQVRQGLRSHPTMRQIIRGICIAVPLILVFIGLFASADLVFRKYIADAFGFQINGEIFTHLFLILAVGGLSVGWLAYVLRSRSSHHDKPQPTTKAWPQLGAIELAILLGSLNLLFVGFLIIQARYLFGGEESIMAQGFTYAEYARKGFFELIAVAALAFGLVVAIEKMTAKASDGTYRRFKLLAGVLLVQVLVVMLSAYQRLSLYEEAYGFTALRFYSHLFIIWLAVMLALQLYRLVRNKLQSMVVAGGFMSVLLFAGIINVMNVDGFIATQNIARFNASGKLDSSYLSHLSHDAVPYIVPLLTSKHADPLTRSRVASGLVAKYDSLQEQPWQSANLSRHNALNALEDSKKHWQKAYHTTDIYPIDMR